MIEAKFKKTGHITLTTPLLWVVCHHRPHDLIQSTCMQNLTILASAVPKISLGASKFKVGHVTLTTPLLGTVCHPWASTCYDQYVYQI